MTTAIRPEPPGDAAPVRPPESALEFATWPENRPPAQARRRLPDGPPTSPDQPVLIPLRSDPPPADEGVDEAVSRFAGGLMRAILEVLQGRRPASQLTRWLSDAALAELLHRVRQRRHGHVWTMRSVRVQQPGPNGAEVTFRIGHGRRDAALAMRLDQRGGRWMCSVLDFGPGPFLP